MATFSITTSADRTFDADTSQPLTALAEGEKVIQVVRRSPLEDMTDADRKWVTTQIVPHVGKGWLRRLDDATLQVGR